MVRILPSLGINKAISISLKSVLLKIRQFEFQLFWYSDREYNAVQYIVGFKFSDCMIIGKLLLVYSLYSSEKLFKNLFWIQWKSVPASHYDLDFLYLAT
jgi:hypothetical protein